MSKSSGVIHTTSVSRPQLKCYQVKDKVVPNNSQVKFQKKEVEDHHRISSISKKTKSVTACNDSSNSRTSNGQIVQLILFIVDSGCTKHMTGNLKLLCNFVEKFLAVQASVFMAMMSVHISSGLVLHQMTSDHNRSELGIQDHSNEQSSSKLVPKVVP
ncbi:hypothetical protein Tco_1101460 [Tanacetum coccineum]